MSENLQTLMKRAFLNNSYDYESMDKAIDMTWMNSFSYLYGLQKSAVEYEELFYYSGETISRNSKKIGNLYLDKLLYANFDVDYDMIHVYNREEFRRSDYYDKFYSYQTLVDHPEIFTKMPVIIIDDHVIYDYDIFSNKDTTTIKLPFKRQFVLYDERNNVLFGKYDEESGEFILDDGQSSHGSVKDTNMLYVEVTKIDEFTEHKTAYVWNGEGYSIRKDGFKDWDEVIYKEHKIQILIIDNIFYERILTNKNTLNFSVNNKSLEIPKSMITGTIGSHNKGIMMLSIHYPNSAMRGYELGSALIPLDESDDKYTASLTDDIVADLRSFNLNIYISLVFVNNLFKHEMYYGSNEIKLDEYGYLLVIESDKLIPYDSPIPLEDLMIFRKEDDTSGYKLVKNNEILKLHYPNIYSFNEDNVSVGETYKVYYFYSEQPDLKYTILFDFYFRFLLTEFPTYLNLEEVMNAIYRDELNHSYSVEQLESFKQVFYKILDYQFYNHQYNETDFLYRYLPYGDNYDKTPIEYKDETLKSWIKVEPHVLRDYVLEQKKLGENYHLFTNTINLESRLRYDTATEFDGHKHQVFPDGAYVFAMQNIRPYPELLDLRVFVDGIFIQDMYQRRKLFMDYIYIPCHYVTDDSYIELEVFPAYTYRTDIKFDSLKEYKHVILDKPEEKIWPTLADIYFTSDERPDVRYDSNFFDIVEHYKTGTKVVIYRPTSDPTSYYKKDGFVDEIIDDEVVSVYKYSLFNVHDEVIDYQAKEYKDLEEMVINGTAYKDTLPSINRGSFPAVTDDDTKPVKFTRLDTFDVRPNDETILGIPMTLNITKGSMRIIVRIVGDGCYPYFKLTHTDFNFSYQYIRIFRNGRLVPRCKYQFNKLYSEPTLMLLDYYTPGEEIMLDISPYRYTEVYFKEELEPGETIIDLKGYITKPFDIRYYEVYMNGRKLSINNVFAISPYEITLVNLKSLYNLEIFERERDWEYFGTDYTEHMYYYNIEDLFSSNFITESTKNQLIMDIIERDKDRRLNIYPNTNDEEKQDRTDIRKYVQMYNFYHTELIPKTYSNPDRLQESTDVMEDVYPLIDEAYRKKPYLEATVEKDIIRKLGYCHAVLLDPDIVIGDDNPNNKYVVFPVGHLEDRVPEEYLPQVPKFIIEPNIAKE